MPATLHIEHPITDITTWKRTFDGFAEARAKAGVRAAHVRQPIDDARYVVIDLEFDDAQTARAFEDFLRRVVWATPANSPALAGTPRTVILEPASTE